MMQRALILMPRKYQVFREIKKIDMELARLKGIKWDVPQIQLGARNEVVWRLPVPNKADVFMTTEGASDSNFVVYVNGLAFYRAWLCLKVDDYQACPLKQDMPNDRKFHWSEAHFAIGIENPVPLADVVPTEVSGRFAVAFIDGMTRSMWLLSNDVPVFPVMVSDEASAVKLAKEVGVAQPIQIGQLRKQVQML